MYFNDIFQVDFCVRIVQTLAHFLWQGLAIVALALAMNWVTPQKLSNVRYAVNCFALLFMFLCLPTTFAVLSLNQPREVNRPNTSETKQVQPETVPNTDMVEKPVVRVSVSPTSQPVGDTAPKNESSGSSELATAARDNSPNTKMRSGPWQRTSPYVVVTYLIGVLLMLARLGLAVIGGHRLRHFATPINESGLLALVAKKTKEFGLRVAPVLASSERVMAPILVGVVKPMILLPASLLTALSPSQIETVLAHELAHIRRWDPLTNLIQRVVESIVFFHPAVWYVSRCISQERENCCDDMVLANGIGAVKYAELLVRVSELSQTHVQPADAVLSATGNHASSLRQRVLRLFGQSTQTPLRLTRSGIITAIFVLLSLVASSFYFRTNAQTTNNPEPNPKANSTKLGPSGHYRGNSARTGSYQAAGVKRLGDVRILFKHPCANPGGVVVAGDVVYFGGELETSGKTRAYIFAVNRKTGKEVWRVDTNSEALTSYPAVENGHVYFGSYSGDLFCVRADTGKIRWKRHFDSMWVSPTISNDMVFVATIHDKSPSHIYAVDARTGKTRWKQKNRTFMGLITNGVHGMATSVSTVCYKDGVGHMLVVRDARTGKSQWETKIPIETLGQPVIDSRSIYLYAKHRPGVDPIWQGKITAYRVQDGKRMWSTAGEVEIPPNSLWPSRADGPGMAVGGDVAVFNTEGGQVYGVHAIDGKRLWKREYKHSFSSSPSIAGSIVYLATTNGQVAALNLMTGQTLWEHNLNATIEISPVIQDNRVLLMDNKGRLHQFSAEKKRKDQPNKDTDRLPIGKTIEVWINDQLSGKPSHLDFDLGHVYAVPAKFFAKAPPKQVLRDWLNAKGIDAVADSKYGLYGFGSPVGKIENAKWEQVTLEDAQKALATQSRSGHENLFPSAIPRTPDPTGNPGVGANGFPAKLKDSSEIYAFRTSSGSIGIVQIVDADLPNQRQKIRLRLLKHSMNNADPARTQFVWSQIFERTLTFDVAAPTTYLKLSSGEPIKPTWTQFFNPKQIRAAGVDVYHSPLQSNTDQRLCLDMITVKVANAWHLHPDQALNQLEQAKQQGNSTKNATPFGTYLNPNVTYVFETRDGCRGVLELVPEIKNGIRISKIRYRVIHAQNAEAPLAQWGKSATGLRCRWLPLKQPLFLDKRCRVQMVVENVTNKAIFWECRNETTWALQRATDKRLWTMPKFQATLANGTRHAKVSEVRNVFGIGYRNLKDSDPAPDYFLLLKKGRLIIECELPWKFTKPGRYIVHSQLARRNPRTNKFLDENEWLRCPALVLEVNDNRLGNAQRVHPHPDVGKLNAPQKVAKQPLPGEDKEKAERELLAKRNDPVDNGNKAKKKPNVDAKAGRNQLIGTWCGGGFLPVRLTLRDNGTFEQAFDAPNQAGSRPESGTWKYDGKTLTRKVLKSSVKKHVGTVIQRKVLQLDTKVLRLEDDGAAPWKYERATVFRGWLLLPSKATTDFAKIPDIWQERPVGSGSYEIRREVKVIDSGFDGVVYHRPDRNVFYIQADPLGASQLTYYGPYTGNPRKLLRPPMKMRP